jgi:hypothetical protein
MIVCGVPGCPNVYKFDGLCYSHFKKRVRFGDPEYKPIRVNCSEPGCEYKAVKLGLCKKHQGSEEE